MGESPLLPARGWPERGSPAEPGAEIPGVRLVVLGEQPWIVRGSQQPPREEP